MIELLGEKITPNFSLSEYACHGKLDITPGFIVFAVQVVQPFRSWYGREITINSGYRTRAYNMVVGGDIDSLHLYGRAIDFNLPSTWGACGSVRQAEFLANIKGKWFALCRKAGGYGQMTVHNGWVHMALSWNREHYEDRR